MHGWHHHTKRLLAIWFIIVPITSCYLIVNFFPDNVNGYHLFMVLLLTFLSALFPVTIQGVPIRIVIWITVPAFLMYGVVVELIAMQIVGVIIAIAKRDHTNRLNHLIFNSLSFFIISILSAYVFTIAGGKVGMLAFWPLLGALILYQLVQRILRLLRFTFYVERKDDVFKRMIIEFSMTFLILPFTIALYYLWNLVGASAFFLVGIPFFFILIILKRYNDTEKINRALESVSTIVHHLTMQTKESEVIHEFIESVADLFHADGVYLYNFHQQWLQPLAVFQEGTFQPIEKGQGVLHDTMILSLIHQNESYLFERRIEWGHVNIHEAQIGMESMFAIPIFRDDTLTGVLVVTSKRKGAFKQYHLYIGEILSSYFTVSIFRARHIKEATHRSERCGLTTLYNFAYLEERLQFEFDRLQKGNIGMMTVLIVDIDYFKNINDTYGHEAGNEALIELANILTMFALDDCIVGRYGGEEFVLILPNCSKEEGVILGEQIRSYIELHPFQLESTVRTEETKTISITVSIGVSSIPQDGEALNTLLRNADRALYLGAKRAGRNRVASYVS